MKHRKSGEVCVIPPFSVGDKIIPVNPKNGDPKFIIVKSVEWYVSPVKDVKPYWLINGDGYDYVKTCRISGSHEHWKRLV